MKKNALKLFVLGFIIFCGCSSSQNSTGKENEQPIVISLYPKEVVLDSINQKFVLFCETKNVSKKTQRLVYIDHLSGIQDENRSFAYPYCFYENGERHFPYGPIFKMGGEKGIRGIYKKYKLKPGESNINKWGIYLTLFCWREETTDSIPFKLWVDRFENDKYENNSDTITINIRKK